MNYLLSDAYLPNIEYMSVLLLGASVSIDTAGNYQKQSYRNRCRILSPNGVLTLAIPVCHDTRHNIPMKEVRISNDHPWQRIHWRSLESCYRSSPFFEYFEHSIRPLYENPYIYLAEYNLEWILALRKMMGIKNSADLLFTEKYEAAPQGLIDLRERIHPKKKALASPVSYNQVFAGSGHFEPGLSFADLLFNEGRNSMEWLQPCYAEINKNNSPG